MSSVFVVVPAYNEGAVLADTVVELLKFGYAVVVVDDGSRLPASQCLNGFPVYYLRHLTNLGQGAALQTGTEFALQQGAQFIVHFDADGQHSAELISSLIQPIRTGECDVVIGSRFLKASDRQQVPPEKQILLKVGVFVTWIFSGVWLSDTHNGFRALSAHAASQVRMTENGFAHATEILELFKRAGLRLKEIPATVRYTEYSRSKGQSIFNSINIVFDLLLRKVIR